MSSIEHQTIGNFCLSLQTPLIGQVKLFVQASAYKSSLSLTGQYNWRSTKEMVFIRWHSLPDDYVKVNFDESVHLERETAAIAFARLQEERLAEDNQRVYKGSSNRPVETTKVGPLNANTSSRNLPTRGLT